MRNRNKKEPKTYLTLKDGQTKRSICHTVYGARPKDVLARIQSLIAGGASGKEDRNNVIQDCAPSAAVAITNSR